MQVLINLYETFGEALHTVQELEAVQVPPEDISLIVLNGKPSATALQDGTPIQGLRTKFYSSMVLQSLPGLDPLAANGWLVTGSIEKTPEEDKGLTTPQPTGLMTCLIDHGVDKEHAEAYIEGIRHGSALLGVRITPEMHKAALRIMREDHAPLDPHIRGKHYETGRYNAEEVTRAKKAERVLAMLIAGGTR